MALIGVLVLGGCGSDPRPQTARDLHDPRPVRAAAPTATPAPPALPEGRTVRGAVTRARMAGHITRDRARAYRDLDRRARRALPKLSGRRRVELAGVVGTLDRLAAERRLTASRMPLAFLTLRRNIEVFANRRHLPAPGERLTFGRDPVVFQAFSGQGVQHHPLASFGKANALAKPCLAGRRSCRPRALGRTLDRLVALSSQRAGDVAWEHLFSYGGGGPLWVSGMTQGTAVQALARGAKVLRRARYLRVAESALATFERPPPVGVSVPAAGGRHYLMYSFNSQLRILNGFLQSVIGLHDMAEISGALRARRAYRRGEGAARAAVAAYDTGAWSLYASGGRESTADYHRLVHGFLTGLCERTARDVYCGTERRFGRYLTEPPRIHLAVQRRSRAKRLVPIAFSLSKIAHVAVRVSGPGGRTAMRRRMTLARGAHRLTWMPRARGAYKVRVLATGLSGPKGAAKRTVRIRPLHRRPKTRLARKRPRQQQRAELRSAPRRRPAPTRRAPNR